MFLNFFMNESPSDLKYNSQQCRQNKINIEGGGGTAHYIPSHSVHCYKGNIL